ncbi:MAG: ABC transporter ATP-binding protein [Mycobacteriales bacterium]
MTLRLELDRVSAGYGRVEVLHELSVGVPAGRVVALLGPNGAGKTTTLRVVAGLLAPHSGAVRLDGGAITRRSAYERARLGITLVPEGRGIFPGLSVEDNIDLAVHAARGADDTARAAARAHVLDTFPQLAGRLGQRAGTLSGGEQQMLAMCRALAAASRVLLMDEISMGLAPKVVELLFDSVAALREQGTTIVLVEQYLTYALRHADICYVLAKGRVVFCGEPAELRGGEALAGYLSA